jgi:hypothetical protein
MHCSSDYRQHFAHPVAVLLFAPLLQRLEEIVASIENEFFALHVFDPMEVSIIFGFIEFRGIAAFAPPDWLALLLGTLLVLPLGDS